MSTTALRPLPSAIAAAAVAIAALVAPLCAQQTGQTPAWAARVPIGAALTSGLQGMVVDAAGVAYVTGTTGSSGNTDIVTVAFAPSGARIWSHVYDGNARWHDQARGLALGPGGVLYVTGNTPDQNKRSNLLLLKYNATTGALLNTVQYSSGPFSAELGASVATDQAGNVYVGGDTVGDGPDGMLLKFDVKGTLLWRRTWDGPARAPYSQDHVKKVVVDPAGTPVVLLHGVMATNQPDYVVLKCSPSNGSSLWEATWGVAGGDYPEDMEIDAAGDVFVSGIGINGQDKYSTIKLRGTDGRLLWQAYDIVGYHPSVRGLALDAAGGVYVTGSIDPDGNRSNNDDDFYTVKRDSRTGQLLWTHRYGAGCVGCLDLPGDLIVDAAGNLFLAGSTSSPPYSAAMITFLLDSSTGVEIGRATWAPGTNRGAGATVLGLDRAQNLLCGGGTQDFNSGAREILVVKYPTKPTARRSGVGCRGSGAQPLTLSAGSLPRVPNPGFAVDVSGGPAATLRGLVFANKLAVAPIPLGLSGCTVQVDPATLIALLATPGGTVSLPIPPLPSLLGYRVALQGWAVDSITSQLVTSNALTIMPGL